MIRPLRMRRGHPNATERTFVGDDPLAHAACASQNCPVGHIAPLAHRPVPYRCAWVVRSGPLSGPKCPKRRRYV
eukprot:5146377-Prymnesium_polylepis.1